MGYLFQARKSGWRERRKRPGSKATGMARRRKEEADGRRAALGRCPCEPGLIRSAGYRRRCGIPEGEGPGLTAGGGDRDFIPGL